MSSSCLDGEYLVRGPDGGESVRHYDGRPALFGAIKGSLQDKIIQYNPFFKNSFKKKTQFQDKYK